MENSCQCSIVGRDIQLFRIRQPERLFDSVADVGSDFPHFFDERRVWSCCHCGQRFAWMRILFEKGLEEILVRADSPDWQSWDWPALAEIAHSSRWRGEPLDKRYVI
jgi:hypothetical protein